MPSIHIVGAGVSGLACAVELAESGHQIFLHEGAGHAGGRCRSYHDTHLGCTIDNGNHLLLSGNIAVHAYLRKTNALDQLIGPDDAVFPFIDLTEDLRWAVRIAPGRLQNWVLHKNQRIPGTGIWDYVKALRILSAKPDQSLGDVVDTDGALFRRFWDPFAVGVLNTPAAAGSATLLAAVFRETFLQGRNACMPRMARHGLSETFVTPALKYLGKNNVAFQSNRRLKEIELDSQRATRLHFVDDTVEIADEDRVVLAVPPHIAQTLLPDLTLPTVSHPIVNAHFRVDQPVSTPDQAGLIGVVGGTAHWIFVRNDIISVTVSAADELSAQPAEQIAQLIWRDICRTFEAVNGDIPAQHRVVKERRATFSQTPASIRDRPGTHCGYTNLFLAGDWTNTGLPATIEGSIRSGNAAAKLILGH